MNWLLAFFSYWLSPLYLLISLLFGLGSYLAMFPNKNSGLTGFMYAKPKPVRIGAAIIFFVLCVLALYAAYGALVFQYYLTVKKLHP